MGFSVSGYTNSFGLAGGSPNLQDLRSLEVGVRKDARLAATTISLAQNPRK